MNLSSLLSRRHGSVQSPLHSTQPISKPSLNFILMTSAQLSRSYRGILFDKMGLQCARRESIKLLLLNAIGMAMKWHWISKKRESFPEKAAKQCKPHSHMILHLSCILPVPLGGQRRCVAGQLIVTARRDYKLMDLQVPLTHKNLTRTMSAYPSRLAYIILSDTENIQLTYRLTSDDRTLLVMPLFHVHGLLAGFLAPLFSGGSVIVPQRFSASEFWDNFIIHKANWYTAVPTIHQILLRNPPPSKIPKIRFIRSCSSPLSPKTFNELEKAFNAPVLEAYAMTEGAHQITSNPLPPAKRYPGSVGIGQGVEVKILDQKGTEVPQGSEAEICIRGENVTKGYLNNPEANKTSFTENGFFRTGDQGKQDEDGYVIITGRIKELINKGGEKISPVEIDNVVAQNPSVAEAVSFAIADEMYGQDIGLALVLKDGAKATPEELRKWIATKVAKFKVPKQVRNKGAWI